MNTNTTGSDGFQISLRPCVMGESSLSIGRVKAFFLRRYAQHICIT